MRDKTDTYEITRNRLERDLATIRAHGETYDCMRMLGRWEVVRTGNGTTFAPSARTSARSLVGLARILGGK